MSPTFRHFPVNSLSRIPRVALEVAIARHNIRDKPPLSGTHGGD